MSEGTRDQTHGIGWQGLTLRVPTAWEPQSLSGNRAQGALQLDDGEAIRLRCTWRELRRPPDLLAEAENYIRGLEKAARKKGFDFSVKRDVPFPLPGELAGTCFLWRGEETTYASLLYCQECRRLSGLYVFGRPGQGLEREARQVLAGFRCHGEGGHDGWSIFGLSVELPSTWELAKSELRAGQVTLQLLRGREELSLSRVALARSILRRQKFVRWAQGFYGKPLAAFRWKGERTEYRGHIALAMEGQERLRGPLPRLFRKARQLRGRAWYCQELDKIYSVWYVGDDGGALEGLAAEVPCHQTHEEYLGERAAGHVLPAETGDDGGAS
jgi:hypothetical protein